MKQHMSKILTFVYLGVFIVSAFLIGKYFYTYYETSKSLKESQEIYETALETTDELIIENPDASLDEALGTDIRPQFVDLQKVNENIVGWVSAEGTKLNNPILQAEDNEFYLDRNFKDKSSRAGSVFMDYRNDMDAHNRNTILYGHAMKNGTMFGDLKKYGEQDYAEKHASVYFDSLYEGYDVEVFAAYETTIDFYYIETDFETDEEFNQYIDEVKERSSIEMPVDVNPDDEIITLSTCDNLVTSNDRRYVVQGKLVKR